MKKLEKHVEVSIPRKEFFRVVADVCQSEFGSNVTADNYNEFLNFCSKFIKDGINELSEEREKM